MKISWRDYGPLLAISGVIILLDRLTKAWVLNTLDYGEVWAPAWLEPYARIVHWRNTGAAFGLFQGFGLVFTILAILVSIAIIYYFPRVPARDWPLRVAMAMQMGGAIGNLIDRLTIGEVVDFISVGRFAVFNIADASITVGVVVLLLGVWLMENRERAARRAAEHGEQP